MLGNFQERKARYDSLNTFAKSANLFALAASGALVAISFFDGKVLKNETSQTPQQQPKAPQVPNPAKVSGF
jgi:hypothetical protein